MQMSFSHIHPWNVDLGTTLQAILLIPPRKGDAATGIPPSHLLPESFP